jgi:hypothetical protein
MKRETDIISSTVMRRAAKEILKCVNSYRLFIYLFLMSRQPNGTLPPPYQALDITLRRTTIDGTHLDE